MAISYCDPCRAIFAFSKFIRTYLGLTNPYQHSEPTTVLLPQTSWDVPDTINLDVLRRRLVFKRLDPSVLTNLQLFESYQQLDAAEGFHKAVKDSLTASTPSLELVRKSSTLDYPFLALGFRLDASYDDFFGKNAQ